MVDSGSIKPEINTQLTIHTSDLSIDRSGSCTNNSNPIRPDISNEKSLEPCNNLESALLLRLESIENKLMHLDSYILSLDFVPGTEYMAYKINRRITHNGQPHWIHANTEQEYAAKLLKLVNGEPQTKGKHNFSEYAWKWFTVYSEPNIETATATTYERQLTLYLIPQFGERYLEDIATDDIQLLFNGVKRSLATKQKIATVLNMILDAAVEDSIIEKNPMKSKRLRITGYASKFTQEYSVEQMQHLVHHLGDIQSESDRTYLALQALHPLRLEEVLGLQWQDIDLATMTIHVRRAVTHPTRNQPEIKDPKTYLSARDIGLSSIAVEYLTPGSPSDFVLGGSRPLSYSQVRRMCNRIQKDTGFTEKVTPIRFRTTVLTDLYNQTHDIKQTQAAAGHTTAAMTLKHYVKGRAEVSAAASAIDRAYSAPIATDLQTLDSTNHCTATV